MYIKLCVYSTALLYFDNTCTVCTHLIHVLHCVYVLICQSTVSSLRYRFSYTFICCISSFLFSMFHHNSLSFFFFHFHSQKKLPSINGMHCSARLNMLYLHCPLTSGQCGYNSTYHDICIVSLPKNGLHCNVCLSTVINK